MATQAQLAAVQQLYVGYLGRAADSAGQQFWANAIANGTATIASVATGFTLSAEYKAAYGGLTTDALVEKVYNNVLGRTPDAEGKAFWVAALASGKVTADTLVATIVTNLGALDQQTINNKVFVAQTYTDNVGANYNVAAGSAVLVGVDSTAASVAAATAKIAAGSLPGQVPGEGLVNALAAAQAAEAAVQTGNTAAVNALVTKLAAPTVFADGSDATGTATDGALANYAAKVNAITLDAKAFRDKVSLDSTTVLQTKASDAAIALTAATTGVTAAADKALVATYNTAVANEASALAAKPTAIVKGNVIGGLQADASAAAGLATLGTPKVIITPADPTATPPVAEVSTPAVPATAAKVYTDYVNGTALQRAAIETALKDSAYFATFKETVVKDASYLDAVKAKLAAQDALDTDATASTQVVDGVTISNADAGGGTAATNTYINAAKAKAAADALVAKAVAADADVAAVKVITDANKVANDATVKAGANIDTFNNDPANVANKVEIKAINVAAPGTNVSDSTVKETFYFADKAGLTAGTDYVIGTAGATTQFGAGDSIVLGSGLTYNSGALSTGDNNKAEFFLVKSDAGVQVVVESTVAGSTNTATNATTGAVTTTGTDTTTVITLTGVSIDHVSVANGVISYV